MWKWGPAGQAGCQSQHVPQNPVAFLPNLTRSPQSGGVSSDPALRAVICKAPDLVPNQSQPFRGQLLLCTLSQRKGGCLKQWQGW